MLMRSCPLPRRLGTALAGHSSHAPRRLRPASGRSRGSRMPASRLPAMAATLVVWVASARLSRHTPTTRPALLAGLASPHVGIAPLRRPQTVLPHVGGGGPRSVLTASSLVNGDDGPHSVLTAALPSCGCQRPDRGTRPSRPTSVASPETMAHAPPRSSGSLPFTPTAPLHAGELSSFVKGARRELGWVLGRER